VKIPEAALRFSAEVIVLFNGFVYVPGALEVFRKDYEVAGAEGYRVLAVCYGYPALYQQTSLFFRVGPVKGAGLTLPYRPFFAGCGFGLGRFFDDNVFDGRHIAPPSVFIKLTGFLCSETMQNYTSEETFFEQAVSNFCKKLMVLL
jgi:hypothetical protein